jgi:hypothetical protein
MTGLTTGGSAAGSPGASAIESSRVAPPRVRDRALIALVVAAVTALVTLHVLRSTGDPRNANDFTFYWRAARAVLSGLSPYRVINPEGPYPYNDNFLYPLPAALVAAPFALLRLWPGMVAFTATLAGTLTFVLTRDGFWRLPLLMSFPMLWCAQSGQLAPLLLASAFAPTLGGLAVAKPTIAAAAFAYGLRRRFLVSAAVVLLASLAIAPGWPNEYVAEVGARTTANYHIPLLVFPGVVLPLALLRWRRPEARLLFVMACVPQSMLFYDQLPLAVVAKSFRQALIVALASYAPIAVIYFLPRPLTDSIADTVATTSAVLVWMYYVPCLITILRRPNTGSVPPMVERIAARLPSWLRGVSESGDCQEG